MVQVAPVLALVLASVASQGQRAEPVTPAASAQIDGMIERLGGAEALGRVRSLSVEADCSGPGGAFRTWVDSFRPGYVYFRQEAGEDVNELWTTPEQSWRLGEDGAALAVSPGVRSFLRGHEFHLLLFELPERFTDYRITGPAEDAGRTCTRIAMTDGEGHPAALCLAADGLPLVLEMNPPGAEGPLAIRFEDWQALDGALYFRAFELREGAERVFSYRYEKIAPNAVSALRFVPPLEPGPRVEQDAILTILRNDQRAHLETDAERLSPHMGDNLVEVSGGEVRIQSRDEVLAFFSSYFAGATYRMWEDTRPPTIRFSADRTMAWVVRSVRAARVSRTASGGENLVAFTSAYTSTYEKQDGGWKMTSVTSTFLPPA